MIMWFMVIQVIQALPYGTKSKMLRCVKDQLVFYQISAEQQYLSNADRHLPAASGRNAALCQD